MEQQTQVEWIEKLVFSPEFNFLPLSKKCQILDEKLKTEKRPTKAEKLGITQFPYAEYDEKKRIVYYEKEHGFWYKVDFHKKGGEMLVLFNTGLYLKREFDDKGKQIYCETFAGVISDKRDEQTKKKGRPKSNLNKLT
jgi:hypothetical protein